MRLFLSVALICLWSGSAKSECLDSVRWYKRAQGQYTDVETPKSQTEASLIRKKTLHAKSFDAQYGQEIEVRGYRFSDLASWNKFAEKGDLALLHFANGMVIPYPWTDSDVTNKLDLLIACEFLKNHSTVSFPKLERPDTIYKDPRPVVFSDNKVVVKSLFHPMHPQFEKSGFSPWRHMNSLAKIELVDQTAYYNQFRPSDPGFSGGLDVFMNRCQFCHGVHKIGARFGWDFAGPLPIHVKRSVESLLVHVKTPKAQAFELGTLMPHQKDIAEGEVRDLWAWAKHMTERTKLNPYQK